VSRDHDAASHPDVIARQLGLLLGLYRMMRQIVPQPPPDLPDLTDEYLLDLAAMPPRHSLW
jgi:hypothetical protein